MSKAIVTIRIATPDDFAMLSDLIASSYAMLDDGSYDSGALAAAMPAISRANPELLASGSYFVAEMNGEPAGCGGWTVRKPGHGDVVEGVAHVRHFATHPAHLRKGIARLLLDRCLAEAEASGIRTMMSQSTMPAEQFYTAAGFVRVRTIEVEIGPGVFLPAIEMRRPLP